MSRSLVETPTDFTAFELAEWIEIHLVLNDLISISRSSISTFFPAGQGPDGAEIDQLFAEVRRRADTAPTLYPFRAIDESIDVEVTVDSTVYFLLLVLSIEGAPFRKENRFNEINPSFELLTREALISYGGSGSRGKRFGWPNSDGRPEHLGAAVEWLATEMGLSVGIVHDEVDADDKDGGIDVAAWKPFPDGAPSFSSYLAQCTVQASFERKAHDVSPEKWTAWIRFGKQPEKVLSIPYAVPLDAKARENLKYEVNVLLDRLRLIYLLDKAAFSFVNFDEYQQMLIWTASELERTKLVLSDPGTQDPRRAKRRRPLGQLSGNAPAV